MGNLVPNIRTIPSSVDASVRDGFDQLRTFFTALRKQGGAATVGQLRAAGVVGGDGTPVTPPYTDPTIPPKLVNFAAHGAFSSILLTWDNPRYRNLAYVEIWRATTPDIGQAVKVGTTQALMYSDAPPNASLAVTYYYWGRIVSQATIVGPYSDMASGATANDPGYILEILTGRITESLLYDSLNQRINLIDTPGSGLVDVLGLFSDAQLDFLTKYNDYWLQLQQERAISDATIDIDPVTGEIKLKALAAITTDVEARLSDLEFGMNAADGSITSLTDTVNIQGSEITDAQTAITQLQGDIELKASTTYVDTQVQELQDLVDPEALAQLTGGDIPEALAWLMLFASGQADLTRLNSANIAQAQFDIQTNADAVSAEATARLLLATKVDDNIAALSVEQQARSDADSAMASDIETLVAQQGSNTAAIQVEYNVRAAAIAPDYDPAKTYVVGKTCYNNGLFRCTTPILIPEAWNPAHWTAISTDLYAQYTLRLDVNGYVSGIGMANDGTSADFGILADRFWIMYPDAPAYSPTATYNVGARCTQNGKQYKCTVPIAVPEPWNAAHWTDVLTPFVVDAAYGVVIDTALIKDGTITDAKLGTVNADRLFVTAGTIAQVIIGTGDIENAMIGDVIQSRDYDAANGVGWKIDKAGNVDIFNLNARGTVMSDNYVPNVAGWVIRNTGDAEFNGITARGNLFSSTYQAGVTGWAIYDGGNAQFQDIYARGDIQASSLKANTLMVNEGNINDLQVSTLKIAGNSVTVPTINSLGSFTATAISLWQGGWWYTNVVLTQSNPYYGGKVYIHINSLLSYALTCNTNSNDGITVDLCCDGTAVTNILTRNFSGATTYTEPGLLLGGFYMHQPAAGNHTYSLRVYVHANRWQTSDFFTLANNKIFTLECRR